jgi:hypothetical protein
MNNEIWEAGAGGGGRGLATGQICCGVARPPISAGRNLQNSSLPKKQRFRPGTFLFFTNNLIKRNRLQI